LIVVSSAAGRAIMDYRIVGNGVPEEEEKLFER